MLLLRWELSKVGRLGWVFHCQNLTEIERLALDVSIRGRSESFRVEGDCPFIILGFILIRVSRISDYTTCRIISRSAPAPGFRCEAAYSWKAIECHQEAVLPETISDLKIQSFSANLPYFTLCSSVIGKP